MQNHKKNVFVNKLQSKIQIMIKRVCYVLLAFILKENHVTSSKD